MRCCKHVRAAQFCQSSDCAASGAGKLHIMEINPDGSVFQKITLPGVFDPLTYLHDFVVTPNWHALCLQKRTSFPCFPVHCRARSAAGMRRPAMHSNWSTSPPHSCHWPRQTMLPS